jgi:hypothetical protein
VLFGFLSLSSQENSPIGSKVLQLILSDPDSPENGPPYSFRITKGNPNSVFRVTPDGWLVTKAVLSRRVQQWYQLQIEVRWVWAPGGAVVWWGQYTCWQVSLEKVCVGAWVGASQLH